MEDLGSINRATAVSNSSLLSLFLPPFPADGSVFIFSDWKAPGYLEPWQGAARTLHTGIPGFTMLTITEIRSREERDVT